MKEIVAKLSFLFLFPLTLNSFNKRDDNDQYTERFVRGGSYVVNFNRNY